MGVISQLVREDGTHPQPRLSASILSTVANDDHINDENADGDFFSNSDKQLFDGQEDEVKLSAGREEVGKSWDILNFILVHRYHQNHSDRFILFDLTNEAKFCKKG